MAVRNHVCCLILGKSGSGKSLLARLMLAMYVLHNKRDYYVSISLKEDHFNPPVPDTGPCYEIYLHKLGFDEMKIRPGHFRYGQATRFNWDRILRQQPRLCVTTEGLAPEGYAAVIDGLSRTLLRKGHAVILIDEAERFIPRSRCAPGILDLLRQGRYRGVDMIIVSHADTGVHPEVLLESNMLVLFNIRHPTRVERLRHYLDDPGVVATLDKYEYILIDDAKGGYKIRRYSTEDLQWLKRLADWLFEP